MSKKIVSTLMALVMALSLLPVQVLAAGADYTTGEDTAVRKAVRMQTAGSDDITGTGASDDPYLVYTAAGLKAFRDMVNGGGSTLCGRLMNDIVLNDGTFDKDGNWSEDGTPVAWEPIGWFESDSSNVPYTGTFDGQGHTVKGLYVKDVEYAGLFGYAVNAAIKNVTVDGYVSAGQYSGGIAGELTGGSVTSCFNFCTVNAALFSGGIAGLIAEQCKITACGNAGTVSGGSSGGVVGCAKRKCVIQNCYNAGAVSAYSAAGGIAVISYNSSIIACYNTGTVTKSENAYVGAYVGGIIGDAFNSGSIYFCYWLKGTARNAAGYDPEGTMLDPEETVLAPDAKTKEEFADGTVLTLLKNGDENSPWEKCGYLSAAGMTLPLLKGQTADSHTHTPGAVLGQCDCGAAITDGSPEKPYEIYNADHLKQFRDIVNGSNGQTQNIHAHAKLMNDIVLNDGTFDENGNWSEGGTPDQWTPIVGYYGYRGTFDGGGHTIRGLYVKGGEYAGLFGIVYQGAVKNVTVTGYVEGTQCVGGIAGYINSATISGCTNAATVKAKRDDSFIDVGGIVGRLFNEGNVRSCTNSGSVWAQIDSDQGEARVGGIAGYLQENATIADCYNGGSITIEDSGTGEHEVSHLGGIVGSTTWALEPNYVSNCYSVGSLTYRGSASAEICGIAGDVFRCAITNCYWLEGTAESGVGGYPMSSSYAAAKSKADFANGAVLGLLKGDRTDSPWDVCGYLEADGMTLPLLKGQTADSHDHDFAWKYSDTEHWRECACGVIEANSRAAHSGGTATCIAKAECAACGAAYGGLAGHSFTAENTDAQYLKTAATCTAAAVYYKSCAVSPVSIRQSAPSSTAL